MICQQTGQHVEKGPAPASCGEKSDCPLWTFPHILLAIVHLISEFWKVQRFSYHTGAWNLWHSMLWGLAKFVTSQVTLLFCMHGNLHRLPYSVVPTWFVGWFRESHFLLGFFVCFHFLHENISSCMQGWSLWLGLAQGMVVRGNHPFIIKESQNLPTYLSVHISTFSFFRKHCTKQVLIRYLELYMNNSMD